MAKDTYRPQGRKKITSDEVGGSPYDMDENEVQLPEGLQKVRQVQEAMAREVEDESIMSSKQPPAMMPAENPDIPFQIEGNVPEAFKQAIRNQQQKTLDKSDEPPRQPNPNPMFTAGDEGERPRPPKKRKPTPDRSSNQPQSSQLQNLIDRLGQHQWEQFEFPSLGRFYDDIPAVITIRPMTGEEEQILATPRFVRKGKAIDMIFNRCIQQNINPAKLLSVDRTHLLIYLRGISYTPEYDVEIKCPECETKFSTVIDLNMLDVTFCPDEFEKESLEGELPNTGFTYRYRLATGIDEQAVNNYRDKRIQMFGDQSEDDTWLYRTAILLEEIEGVTNPKEIQLVMKRLPIADVSFLRNEVNDPPFGVDTEVPMMCPSCAAEFEIDLPLEASFFFPRKKEKTRV